MYDVTHYNAAEFDMFLNGMTILAGVDEKTHGAALEALAAEVTEYMNEICK